MSTNSFYVLADNYITDKALELRIDVSTLPLETVRMLKDLEHSMDNLINTEDQLLSPLVDVGAAVSVPLIENVHSRNDSREENADDKSLDAEDDIYFSRVFSRRSTKILKQMSLGNKKSTQRVPLSVKSSLHRVRTNHPHIVNGPIVGNKPNRFQR